MGSPTLAHAKKFLTQPRNLRDIANLMPLVLDDGTQLAGSFIWSLQFVTGLARFARLYDLSLRGLPIMAPTSCVLVIIGGIYFLHEGKFF